MIRRDFLRALPVTLGAWAASFPLRAQQPPRVYRIGFLNFRLDRSLGLHLRNALAELGYVEGRNAVFEARLAEGSEPDRFDKVARELVAHKPDIILTNSTNYAVAVARATSTIPIVTSIVSDPVGSGFAKSLTRPGGNVTGITDFGFELAVKDLELVKSLFPGATTVGVIDSDNPVHPIQLGLLRDAAAPMKLAIVTATIKAPADVEPAIASLAKSRASAAIVLGGATHAANRDLIAASALRSRLPTIGPTRTYAATGCLVGFGPDFPETARQMAILMDKILRGATPGDLPFQQPTKFELVVNQKTARAIGLVIPDSLLVRATEVIQ